MGNRRFGKYELIRELASGSFGKTYLAKSPEGRMVALKVMYPHLVNDPKARMRFKREVHVLQKLNHPRIAKIIDSGEVDGIPFIALEFVDSKSLREILDESGKFDEKEALKLFRELALILSYLHEQGIMHRDLKPENILIHKGKPMLIDFGLAKSLDLPSITVDGAVLGTLHYIPPEVLKGGSYTPEGDVYSLGVILYELLSGRRPFEAESVGELIEKVVEGQPERPENISDETWQLLSSLLEKDPSKRPKLYDILTSVEVERKHRPHLIWLIPVSASATVLILGIFILLRQKPHSQQIVESPDSVTQNQAVVETLTDSSDHKSTEMSSILKLTLSHPSDVYVDGRLVAGNAKSVQMEHKPGTVMVEVVNPNYGRVRKMLNLRPSDTMNLDINFDTEFGTLMVKVKPWGYVWFDGKELGTTPLEEPIHGRGRHILKVEHPVFGTVVDTLELRPGDTLVWHHEFQA